MVVGEETIDELEREVRKPEIVARPQVEGGLELAGELVAEIADRAAQEGQPPTRGDPCREVPGGIAGGAAGPRGVEDRVGPREQRAHAIDWIRLETPEALRQPRPHRSSDSDLDLVAIGTQPEVGIRPREGVAREAAIGQGAIQPPESRIRMEPFDDAEPLLEPSGSIEGSERDSFEGVKHPELRRRRSLP